jgi:hypothetical protein
VLATWRTLILDKFPQLSWALSSILEAIAVIAWIIAVKISHLACLAFIRERSWMSSLREEKKRKRGRMANASVAKKKTTYDGALILKSKSAAISTW